MPGRTSSAHAPPRAVSRLDRAVMLGAAHIPAWAAILGLAVMLGAVWYAVNASGGSQRVLPHLFYFPVILAAVPFGVRGSLVTAVVAMILCGPLTPLNTVTGEPQQVYGWVFRGVMFAVMGSLAAFSITLRARYAEQQLASEVRAMGVAPRSQEIDESLVPLVGKVLAERSFHSVFQPIYSLADGHLTGVEALTRFDVQPYRTPDLWFAAAESVGLGVELELAAIEGALAASSSLPRDVVLALNASPATLGDARLGDLVREHPEREFVVEITEHAVVADYHLLQGIVGKLRALGVRIAVDDAGAGFSTLQHIVQLGPETIKVDISLTQGVSTSPLRRALAGSLIEFAQRTGAELIVEGVEEEHDLITWIGLGADAAQGFLIGRPGNLPVDGVSGLIASLRRDGSGATERAARR